MAFERLTEEVRNVSALPNVIVGQASTLKATFDEAGSDIKNFINNFLTALEAFSAASNIGAMNGDLESNLQAIIDEFATSIADRYTKAEIDSKVSTDTGDLVKTLAIDLNTGVFTITKKDGTVETIDTALEKVPTNFAFVEENGTYYLRVTNTDGTSTQADVTALFNDYTFNNSDSIAFTVVKDGNKATIAAEIRDASIGIEKLSLTAVSQLEGYVSSASQSAQTAITKANEASESATNAFNSANTAMNAANSVVDSATSAQTSANNAATFASAASSSAANATSQATLSQSWAVGNTGTRDGENTNNAKYWAEQARNSSQGGGTECNIPKLVGTQESPINLNSLLNLNGNQVILSGYVLSNGQARSIKDITTEIMSESEEVEYMADFLSLNEILIDYSIIVNDGVAAGAVLLWKNITGTTLFQAQFDGQTGIIYAGTATFAYATKDNVLTKTNTDSYTPTEVYHPATKKYVDSQVEGKSTTKHFTATIPTTGWSSSAPYTNTITVSGMLASDRNFPVSPVYSDTLSTRIAQAEAWGKVTMIAAGNNSIVVTCDEEIPTTAIPIQITVVR